MKILLMVAAGVAVGLTAAIAVLIEVLSRLIPLLVIVALIVLALRVMQLRNARRVSPLATASSTPMVMPAGHVPGPPATRAPLAGLPAAAPRPAVGGRPRDVEASYLRWGPQTFDGPAALAPAVLGDGYSPRARPAGRPPRGAQGHRP